jgi:hypothetical protein
LVTTATPVPDRATADGLPVALCATESVAERAPAALGVKVKITVQLPPLAARLMLAVQEPPVTANSALAVDMPESTNGAVPVLLTVTVCVGEAAVPTVADPKLKLVGLTWATGLVTTATPVPDKLAVELAGVALWFTVSVAERAPAALGVKVTMTVQLPPLAARLLVAVQVPPVATNSVLPVEIPDNTKGAVPELLTVTVCVAAAMPTVDEPKLTAVDDSAAVGAPTTPHVPVAAAGLTMYAARSAMFCVVSIGPRNVMSPTPPLPIPRAIAVLTDASVDPVGRILLTFPAGLAVWHWALEHVSLPAASTVV